MLRRTLLLLLIAAPSVAAPSSIGSNAAALFTSTTFAGLSTPSNASVRYCSNCNQGTFPCTGGAGSGSFAFRIGGAWACPTISSAAAPAYPLLAPDGTVNTPPFSFASESTLGLIRPGAGQLGITSAGLIGWFSSTGYHAFGTIVESFNDSATSADGFVLDTNGSASAGVQKFSPRLRFNGQGWKTDATAASRPVDWIVENQPVQGTANPSSNLVFSSQINGGGYVSNVIFGSGGTIQTLGNVGIGAAQSATQGIMLLSSQDGAFLTKNVITNTSGLDGAGECYQVAGDAGANDFLCHRNSGNSGTALGVSSASIMDILSLSHSIVLRTIAANQSISLGTNDKPSIKIDGATQSVILSGPSIQNAAVKTLTESSATAFVAITVANSSACSGYVDYTVFAADATNTQAKSGQLFFSTVANSSGTVTKATISDVNTLNPVSSGTLTNTMTDTTGANTYTLLANAASSLTQTTLNIKYLVHITSGNCTVTAQ